MYSALALALAQNYLADQPPEIDFHFNMETWVVATVTLVLLLLEDNPLSAILTGSESVAYHYSGLH